MNLNKTYYGLFLGDGLMAVGGVPCVDESLRLIKNTQKRHKTMSKKHGSWCVHTNEEWNKSEIKQFKLVDVKE